MSNTSNGKAQKGSKRHIQVIASNKEQIEKLLNNDNRIEWISPIEKDAFKEYQLNGEYLRDKLGFNKDVFKNFWPSRQPQWDGIALSETGTLYLFEAKAHKNEPIKGKKATSQCNEKKIEDAIKSLMNNILKVNVSEELYNLWRLNYYQITNRLAFKSEIERLLTREEGRVFKFNSVCLVFLLFCNDPYFKDRATKESWEKHFDCIFENMQIFKGYNINEKFKRLKKQNILFLFPNANTLFNQH